MNDLDHFGICCKLIKNGKKKIKEKFNEKLYKREMMKQDKS